MGESNGPVRALAAQWARMPGHRSEPDIRETIAEYLLVTQAVWKRGSCYDSLVRSREGLMKRFVEGVDRSQGTLFPDHLEDWVGDDNPVRAIDVLSMNSTSAAWGSTGSRRWRPAGRPIIRRIC